MIKLQRLYICCWMSRLPAPELNVEKSGQRFGEAIFQLRSLPNKMMDNYLQYIKKEKK
ncbi:MAG: hypothetical protein ABIU63_01505 [Chitinophagaceae bacterium]